jgi:hypothetical protein
MNNCFGDSFSDCFARNRSLNDVHRWSTPACLPTYVTTYEFARSEESVVDCLGDSFSDCFARNRSLNDVHRWSTPACLPTYVTTYEFGRSEESVVK